MPTRRAKAKICAVREPALLALGAAFIFMQSTSLLSPAVLAIELIGLVVGAAFLWLAAAMRSDLREIAGGLQTAPVFLSVMLVTAGLWWPSHAHAGHSTLCYVALLAAVPLAPLAAAVASGSLRSQRTSVLALSSFGVTMVFLLLVRATMDSGPVTALDMMLTAAQSAMLMSALVLLHKREIVLKMPPMLMRAVAALGASLVVGSASTTHAAIQSWGSVVLQLSTMALLIALASTLLVVLRATKQRVDAVTVAKDRDAIDNDPLTRLATRRSFESQLKAAAKKADQETEPMALLYIDLDGFKAVNESYGHADGDRLLLEMSKRLRKVARDGDLLARVGADEMLLLMRDDVHGATVEVMAQSVVDIMAEPYGLMQREVSLTCSVGIARYPKNGPADLLMGRANAAVQTAKRDGGGRHAFYQKTMDTGARERLTLTSDLRAALERGEFELYYQPKVDAASFQITAAEALIRWHHPTRGLMSPAVFIPIAEQSGLIQPMGDWVIEDACRQAAKWRDLGLRMRVAVNLSAVQLRSTTIVDQILGVLTKYNVDASQLTCEITESVAMGDPLVTEKIFDALGRAGIHLSIDDFGTGYSSLAYLRRLPAKEVKIDRSFVMDLETSEDARAVANAVIQLAHALGKNVVAEGVETTKQAKILVDLGCNHLQGYLYGKPMPASELTSWALDNREQDRTVSFRDSLFVDKETPSELQRTTEHLH
jgi:diguanylate cyclase